MRVLFTVVAALLVTGASAFAGPNPPGESRTTCPVTRPGLPFLAPAPYPAHPPEGTFWFGTVAFWTRLPTDGRWTFQSQTDALTEKVFWWRPAFDGRTESVPQLEVVMRRLDEPAAPIVTQRRATNAHDETLGGWAMLTGIRLPSPGCWEITGRYRGNELAFVVSVGE